MNIPSGSYPRKQALFGVFGKLGTAVGEFLALGADTDVPSPVVLYQLYPDRFETTKAFDKVSHFALLIAVYTTYEASKWTSPQHFWWK